YCLAVARGGLCPSSAAAAAAAQGATSATSTAHGSDPGEPGAKGGSAMLVTSTLPVALYARVSTTQQMEAQTVDSQIAALRERIVSDASEGGGVLEFIDEGYSGTTLVRPALERLRDLAAVGGVELVYVHSPDRLARKYALQALLLDEFSRVGARV